MAKTQNTDPTETTLFGLSGEQLKSVAIAIAATSFIAYKRGQRSGLELFKALAED